MDYKIGSLADLISGNKTPNKTKIIQKTFAPPIKREFLKKLPENEQSTGKFSKKIKIKPEKKLNKIKNENPAKPYVNNKNPLKIKRKKRKADTSNIDLADSDLIKNENPTTPNVNNKNALKIKKKKRKADTSNIDLADGDIKNENPATPYVNNNPLKIKQKKRKADISTTDLADSDAEQPSPKKQKLSQNEENAAGRIKNKINKETKNSGEYKDKTLFVGNIPINIKKEKIKKRFRKYGPIDSVRIRGIPVADPKTSKKVAAIKKEFHPDRNTVYAFIRFINAEDAKKAEVENGELFEDHHLRVHCCESDDKPDESKAIFVGNLAFNAEEEELWNLFKPCGPISHVRIVRDGRTAMSKGFGYVNFKDADSVQLALEMEKVMLRDRELRVSVCDSSRAKKKKAPKKPRNRTRKPKPISQETENDSPKKKKTFKVAKMNPDRFSGSKFDDKKKKRKFNKTAIEKKTLAKKLVASSSV